MDYFEAYGELSKQISDEILCSGRYKEQEKCIPDIIKEITAKLNLCEKDVLLDIGCGTGIISSDLSKKVFKIFLNDNESILDAFKKKYQIPNAFFISGNFLEINTKNLPAFDKILSYSVIHYLKNHKEISRFIEKAISILKPGGILMIGDIPNLSKKARFLSTKYGQEFSKKFSSNLKNKEEIDEIFGVFNKAEKTENHINDSFLMEIIKKQRENGNESFILPQDPEKCAFGYTKEDLIIIKKRL